MAREHAPSIIFMDEIDSVEGVKTAAEVVILSWTVLNIKATVSS
jgi:ATP-dependent Zn protease